MASATGIRQRIVSGTGGAVGWLPDRLRRPAQTLRSLLVGDPLDTARALAMRFRFRRQMSWIMRALFYHRYATTLLWAHELGIFVELTASRSPGELAETVGVHPRSAQALLRILESQGLVERDGPRYRLSPFSRTYLSPGSPHSVAPMLALMNAQASSFRDALAGMRTGQVPPALDIFSADGQYEAFLLAVNAYLDMAARDLLGRIRLPEVRDFIVGSMGVSFSALLLDLYPNSRVTYGCLDHLVARIPDLCERYGVDADRIHGMHAHSGDPAQDRWGDEGFDLVLLTKKMILDPERRIGEAFAKKAFEVLRPNGVAIFWETVHPSDRPTPLVQAMEAVLDLGASPVGPVLTTEELSSTLKEIGFGEIAVHPCLGRATTFVVGRKA